MFKNYLKIAYRNLKRNKGYAFINIAGLAVGLAVCLLMALYVRHERSYDRFHEKADRIFQVLTAFERAEQRSVLARAPVPLGETLGATFPEVERVVQLYSMNGVVRRGEKAFEEELLFATPGFFEMFSFELVRGSPATALDAPDAVVLTRETARKYFGGAGALGRRLSIRLRGTFYDFTVTGIAEAAPSTSSIRYDVLLPFGRLKSFVRSFANPNWGTLSPYIYVQLPSRAHAEVLEGKFSVLQEQVPESQSGMQFRLLPLTAVHLTPGVSNPLEPTSRPAYAYILSGIALFILLIACINFTTLAVSRSARRAREVGMRKVLGAVRPQLIRQFGGEALLMSLVALLLGLALAELLLPAFSRLVDVPLSFAVWGQPVMLLVLGGLLLFVGLLAGSYPALYLSRFDPVTVLKGPFRALGKSRLTRVLVVFQFALSIFFIIGTLFMARQLDLLQTKELGFDEEQVIRFDVPFREGARLLGRYRNALADEPGVVRVSGSWEQLGGGDGVGFNRMPTTSGTTEMKLHAFGVAPGFLETLGIELIEGRSFSEARAGGAVIVNEAMVRQMGWDRPLAREVSVRFTVENAPVIGVVENFHFRSLHHALTPLVMHTSAPLTNLYVRIAPDDVPGTLATLEAAWEETAPEIPFAFTFLDEHIEQQYRADRRWARIISYAALLAVLIACLGLFGLAAFAAERRTKEIGIRKVLGASVPSIVVLLSKDFLKLVLVAFVIAAPLAYYAMSRWLEGFAYRTELGPWIFVGAGALALVIALATVSYQAIRAALANPVEALRAE